VHGLSIDHTPKTFIVPVYVHMNIFYGCWKKCCSHATY